MNDDYRPPLADYWDQMETKYGDGFTFDKLSDEELVTMEKLGRDAVERDPRVTWQEKKNLGSLITLIEMQRQKRGLARPQ